MLSGAVSTLRVEWATDGSGSHWMASQIRDLTMISFMLCSVILLFILQHYRPLRRILHKYVLGKRLLWLYSKGMWLGTLEPVWSVRY